jgi:hypothetical protein
VIGDLTHALDVTHHKSRIQVNKLKNVHWLSIIINCHVCSCFFTACRIERTLHRSMPAHLSQAVAEAASILLFYFPWLHSHIPVNPIHY